MTLVATGSLTMSRRLLAFLLSELKTVRLICQNPKCGRVAEMTPEKLAVGNHQCAFCNFDFAETGRPTVIPLDMLGKAILAAQAIEKQVQVEFVIPDPN
jgi:hypothetical protein